MAKPQNKTPSTNSCFLGCFGFSKNKKGPDKTFHAGGKNKSNRLLSRPMFGLSLRKSHTKTVPVDNNPDKAEAADSKSHTSKLIKKKSDAKLISSKPQSTQVSNHKTPRQSSKAEQVASPDQAAAREKPEETSLQGPEQPNIILGNRKLSAPTRTSSSSLPASHIVKPKPETISTKLSHTVSLPTPDGNKRVGNPRVHTRISSKEVRRKNNEVVEKFDPLLGMSIIIVTLIIMLVWGRLCAVLCTSAWFYFCPRFRTSINNNDVTAKSTANSNELDLNSEEYKKKVVLEGLLERNHRFTI